MRQRLISLKDHQDKFVEAEADRLQISVPDVIRRIIDAYKDKLGF